ncbi:hypothetical protein Tco_0116645, partial [Tanacetum coccineum]
VFILNGGVVDWKSTKQSIFVTSSTDAEYIAAFDASEEAVWIRKFIYGLGVVPTIEEPINLYCDNTRVIVIAKDHGVTKGARHFRVKVHYLRETIEMGDVKLEKVDTNNNLADPFTKALAFPKHSKLTKKIGMIPANVVSDGAFGGVADEEVVREGVVVTSSSLEMFTDSCLGGIMVSLIFLEGLEEEDLVELMVGLFEEDEDGKKNKKDGLFNLKASDQSRKA